MCNNMNLRIAAILDSLNSCGPIRTYIKLCAPEILARRSHDVAFRQILYFLSTFFLCIVHVVTEWLSTASSVVTRCQGNWNFIKTWKYKNVSCDGKINNYVISTKDVVKMRDFLHVFIFIRPEDGGSIFLIKVCIYLKAHTASQPRSPTSTNCLNIDLRTLC